MPLIFKSFRIKSIGVGFFVRKYIFIFTLLITFHILVSQEVDLGLLSEKEILKIIDDAIEAKDQNIISYLSNLGTDFPGYNNYEKYILNKALKLIESDDLSFPLILVESVLYNNLENSEAQELYTTLINKSIEIKERIAEEKIKAEIKREAIAELTEEIDQELIEEERLAEIVLTNKELLDLISEYTDSFDSTHYVTNTYLYPFLTKYYSSEVYDGYMNREKTVNKYNGQSVEFGIGLELKIIKFRTDVIANFSYNDILYDNIKQLSIHVNLSTGFPIIPFPIYFRSGFFYDTYFFEGEPDVAIQSLPSPTFGLGLTGLNFLKVLKLDLSSDFLLAANYTENFEYGVFNRIFLTLNLFRIDTFNIELRGGLDNLFYMEDGLSEYSNIPKFGIGISSYE